MKTVLMVIMAASLTACSTAHKPPTYTDNNQNLRPVNPDMLSQEQIKAVQEDEAKNRIKIATHHHQGGSK